MTWSQPLESARSALALEPTVPITCAPSALAHWQASSPMPPAAAWISTRWPGSTLKVLCRSRYVHVLIHQGFRTPHLVHAHGLGHDSLSLGICSGAQLECETKAIAAGLSTRRFKLSIWPPSGGYAWQAH